MPSIIIFSSVAANPERVPDRAIHDGLPPALYSLCLRHQGNHRGLCESPAPTQR